jgi:hypothetical protein|tara:strand:+ start:282 stop:455 length:174 start_codon:yes stop_codon:yes gene_type:complete
MGLEKLLKKGTSTLSKDGSKPKSFDGQVSKLKKEFIKDSKLGLDGKEPVKYYDNRPV